MHAAVRRAILAFVVFVLWVTTTAFSSLLWTSLRGPEPLEVGIANAVQPAFALAIAVLIAAILFFRWFDVGLNPPIPRRSLRLVWFPALYVALFAVGALLVGLPPAATVLIILVNTLIVGVSEELACRGVLYQGFRSALGVWGAILGSTILFGAVHILNGFATGDFAAAAIQASTAFMTGMAFMAIRFRTRSLYPGMLLHGLWNFALVTMTVGITTRFGAPAAGAGALGWLAVVPILLILPNFLYGLFLLRHAARDEAAS